VCGRLGDRRHYIETPQSDNDWGVSASAGKSLGMMVA
jgi:hypothetical protein